MRGNSGQGCRRKAGGAGELNTKLGETRRLERALHKAQRPARGAGERKKRKRTYTGSQGNRVVKVAQISKMEGAWALKATRASLEGGGGKERSPLWPVLSIPCSIVEVTGWTKVVNQNGVVTSQKGRGKEGEGEGEKKNKKGKTIQGKKRKWMK